MLNLKKLDLTFSVKTIHMTILIGQHYVKLNRGKMPVDNISVNILKN